MTAGENRYAFGVVTDVNPPENPERIIVMASRTDDGLVGKVGGNLPDARTGEFASRLLTILSDALDPDMKGAVADAPRYAWLRIVPLDSDGASSVPCALVVDDSTGSLRFRIADQGNDDRMRCALAASLRVMADAIARELDGVTVGA